MRASMGMQRREYRIISREFHSTTRVVVAHISRYPPTWWMGASSEWVYFIISYYVLLVKSVWFLLRSVTSVHHERSTYTEGTFSPALNCLVTRVQQLWRAVNLLHRGTFYLAQYIIIFQHYLYWDLNIACLTIFDCHHQFCWQKWYMCWMLSIHRQIVGLFSQIVLLKYVRESWHIAIRLNTAWSTFTSYSISIFNKNDTFVVLCYSISHHCSITYI